MLHRLPLFFLLGLLGACTDEATDDTEETDPEETDTEGPTGDGNDTIADATDGTPIEGLFQAQDEIAAPGDRDFYSFTTVPGGIYYIAANRLDQDTVGMPDTIIRLYDAAGTMISEIDDMPRREFETDAAMVLYAIDAGPYFVEVLEWSDWADDGAQGDYWAYNLTILESGFLESNEDDAVNSTDNDTIQDAVVAATDEVGDWYISPWSEITGGTGGSLYMPGVISSAGDVDIFGFDSLAGDDTPFAPQICAFATFPGVHSDLTPKMRLLNRGGDELAATTAPELLPEYGVLWRGGISFPVAEDGGLYIEMSDASGTGGGGHFYMVDAFTCYPAVTDATPPRTQFVFDEESNSDDHADATELPLNTASDGSAKFQNFVGFLEDGDALDAFKIVTGTAAGDTLSVVVDDVAAGSALIDAKLTVRDSGGAEIASATGPNPSLEGVTLPAGTIYLTIESASGEGGTNVYYLATAVIE